MYERDCSVHPGWVLLKALLIFVVLNVCFATVNPSLDDFVWRRDSLRFPVILEPVAELNEGVFQRTYLTDLDLLFRSHRISAPRANDEYRVVLIGDSSVWGVSLFPQETMAAVINGMDLHTCLGQRIVVYNLGYEFGSAPKDMIILSEALDYEPDLAIWFFSLVGFTHRRERLFFVAENQERLDKSVAETENISPAEHLTGFLSTFWKRTLIGRRQELNHLVRLNLSQWMLSMLGTDVPDLKEPRPQASTTYSSEDPAFFGVRPPAALKAYASFDVLDTAEEISRQVKIVYVNEPIGRGLSTGARYNLYYPRWAYDQYRNRIAEIAAERKWTYYDFWDYLPPTDFSDTPFHRTPQGEQRLAQKIAEIILTQSCPQP